MTNAEPPLTILDDLQLQIDEGGRVNPRLLSFIAATPGLDLRSDPFDQPLPKEQRDEPHPTDRDRTVTIEVVEELVEVHRLTLSKIRGERDQSTEQDLGHRLDPPCGTDRIVPILHESAVELPFIGHAFVGLASQLARETTNVVERTLPKQDGRGLTPSTLTVGAMLKRKTRADELVVNVPLRFVRNEAVAILERPGELIEDH